MEAIPFNWNNLLTAITVPPLDHAMLQLWMVPYLSSSTRPQPPVMGTPYQAFVYNSSTWFGIWSLGAGVVLLFHFSGTNNIDLYFLVHGLH